MRLSSAHTSAKRPAMTMRPATGVCPPLLRMRTVLIGASPSAAGRAGPTGLLAAVCVCKPARAPMWAAELVAFAGRARFGKTMMLVFMAVSCVLSSVGLFGSFGVAVAFDAAAFGVATGEGASGAAQHSGGQFNTVFRIRPTAKPSMSKGSSGCTTMVEKSGFSARSSM
jgi:hypothetical protein